MAEAQHAAPAAAEMPNGLQKPASSGAAEDEAAGVAEVVRWCRQRSSWESLIFQLQVPSTPVCTVFCIPIGNAVQWALCEQHLPGRHAREVHIEVWSTTVRGGQ